MIQTRFDGLKRVLCLGAHADDIEIGCGATVLKLLDEQPGLEVCWVVLGSNEIRREEAIASGESFLANAGRGEIIVKGFHDSYFPCQWEPIKDFFHELSSRFSPDLVFTHYRNDAHQDHRVLSELTGCAFRNHTVMEYEIPKYDGDLGQPNVYAPVSRETAQKKIDMTLGAFKSQLDKPWFTEDTLRALLRLRGIECNSPSGFAEAFHGRKISI